MEFVIVTGLSGSGKSCAVNALEDIGYFCIDNMPPQLIPKFAEIIKMGDSDGNLERVAVVTDIRGGKMFLELNENIEQVKKEGFPVKVLFLDAQTEVIQKRYKETRRKHPLYDLAKGDMEKAIAAERDILMPIKEMADYFIDTSLTGTSALKETILNLFLENVSDSMVINCVSFGFKYGVPGDADLVFDVRCLPNPFYLPELKHKTGLDEDVRTFVMGNEKAVKLRDKLYDLLDFLIPMYITEGKTQLVIAFGCTGGKHRSVTFVKLLHEYLSEQYTTVRVLHRDIEKH